MKMFADYHTHTVHSHGEGEIRCNVEAAIKKGLKKIAISDHGSGHIGFGVEKSNFEKMRQEIDKLNEEYEEIEIMLGVEANISGYDGSIDVDEEILKHIDILLVGFHFGVKMKSIKDYFIFFVLNFLSRWSNKIKQYVIEKNTNALIKAIENNKVFMITHPGAKVKVDIKKLAESAEKNNTMLEINTHHGHLTTEEIKIASKTNVDFIISSDAHKPEEVGCVDEAMLRAIESGINKSRIKNIE